MNCPHCQYVTRVYATKDFGILVKRYRRCQRCGHTFKTVEEVYVHVHSQTTVTPLNRQSRSP